MCAQELQKCLPATQNKDDSRIERVPTSEMYEMLKSNPLAVLQVAEGSGMAVSTGRQAGTGKQQDQEQVNHNHNGSNHSWLQQGAPDSMLRPVPGGARPIPAVDKSSKRMLQQARQDLIMQGNLQPTQGNLQPMQARDAFIVQRKHNDSKVIHRSRLYQDSAVARHGDEGHRQGEAAAMVQRRLSSSTATMTRTDSDENQSRFLRSRDSKRLYRSKLSPTTVCAVRDGAVEDKEEQEATEAKPVPAPAQEVQSFLQSLWSRSAALSPTQMLQHALAPRAQASSLAASTDPQNASGGDSNDDAKTRLLQHLEELSPSLLPLARRSVTRIRSPGPREPSIRQASRSPVQPIRRVDSYDSMSSDRGRKQEQKVRFRAKEYRVTEYITPRWMEQTPQPIQISQAQW